MLLKTQAATEIAQFLAHHPTPEQIIAFHPSSKVAEPAFELISTERDGSLREGECFTGRKWGYYSPGTRTKPACVKW